MAPDVIRFHGDRLPPRYPAWIPDEEGEERRNPDPDKIRDGQQYPLHTQSSLIRLCRMAAYPFYGTFRRMQLWKS